MLVFMEHVGFLYSHVNGMLPLHVPACSSSSAASGLTSFGCVPLKSIYVYTASHSRWRTLWKGFFFFLLQVCSDRFTDRREGQGCCMSVSVQGSKTCLEKMNENLEHSSCFFTVGGA